MQPSGPLCTRTSLTGCLQALPIRAGDTILLHSSLRRIGFINGGPETLVSSFLDVLTPAGTFVVPTHTGDNSDPAHWSCPPVPEPWWQPIRDSMPVYNPRITRTRGMGIVPETVRTWPGAFRSSHPQTSFSAIGGKADAITRNHALDSMLGEESPLARLEDADAKVMLLGVGFDVCTCFHLAEYRANPEHTDNSFAAWVDGERKWMTVKDLVVRDHDFQEIGREFVQELRLSKGKVGAADCWVFPLKEAVKFAEKWMMLHRKKR
ncbi:hypothetical protein QQS21_012046 [Conoideocrella luteorostrata]|uniref:Aminoglycoside N(3)-acetyltransferase n=1 Tax=Conoideocrella luteorostrata TaxID=1105319 RepID=A0AAJ0FV87_9HYPO|nr:hypothetical protein QQS21_012046 [Conoideocrella luteorostrata]